MGTGFDRVFRRAGAAVVIIQSHMYVYDIGAVIPNGARRIGNPGRSRGARNPAPTQITETSLINFHPARYQVSWLEDGHFVLTQFCNLCQCISSHLPTKWKLTKNS